MSNNVYPDFPKKDFRLKVRHFPKGISLWDDPTASQEESGKYTSRVVVYSTKDLSTPIFTVYSKCNKADVPRRKTGFRVAYEKAVIVGKALGVI